MGEFARYHQYTVDLNKPLTRQSMGLLLASGDVNGDEFVFTLRRGGEAYDPSVIPLVTAHFMRQDGSTVIIKGEYKSTNSQAIVTLPASCYTNDGHCTLAVKMSGYPNATATIAVLDGYVRKTGTDTLIDPGMIVPTPEDYFNPEAVGKYVGAYLDENPVHLQPLFADSVAECEDTNLVYVLPDGFIYAYTKRLEDTYAFTYEAQTGGYWEPTSNAPTGEWISGNGLSGKRTNIVPVTPGDQLLYKGNGVDSVASVVWLDASKKLISEEQYSTTSGVTVTAPSNAAFVWFASFAYATNVSAVLLDVRWIVCQAGQEVYAWTNTGHAFVPADYEDRIVTLEGKVRGLESKEASEGVADVLKGKTIVYDGDSIAESRFGSSNNGGAYAALIADMTGGSYINQAVGGAMLCARSSGHSVVNNLANLPTDGDLYCFEGGINDYWGDTPIGAVTAGYSDAVDSSTICGAMETIFRYCLNTFVGKPVCFVITHKVQNTATSKNGNGNTFKDYHDAMVQVCEKYSIPYYDAFNESGLNGWNTVQSNAYLTAGSSGTGDGCHPNEEGYKRYYVPQLLALFRRMMAE